jgi:hypothetical protein
MGIFVANGKRFCTKGRRPLVFRMPIRNVPFSIQYTNRRRKAPIGPKALGL